MFEGEALGLSVMYVTQSICVPKSFKVGSLPFGGSNIIMEFIEFGASRGGQSNLGKKLAEMHKSGHSTKGFGFDVNNTIGSTPQINTWTSDWIELLAVYTGSHLPPPFSVGPSNSSQKEHKFPERPGQPECQYYMRIGDYKF